MALTPEGRISGWVNPLAFIQVDEPWASSSPEEVTFETILKFLCPPNEVLDQKVILSRYREISTEPDRLFLAPLEERILDKLVWPLRHAKASYMVGNYLATIALTGMVAEMVALLIWELADPELDGRAMTKEAERDLFGSRFEKLSQERRVRVLDAYGLARPGDKQDFDIIRTTRRRYLHLWSEDHLQLPSDAVKMFHAAVSLVVRVIGQDTEDGKVILNPKLVVYLQRKGLYESVESEG